MIKHSRKLKRLSLTVTMKQEMIDILNKSLGKESNFKQLAITFINSSKQGENYEMKFPKYLKNLKSMHILNICDKHFTETLFDMASQKRLKQLHLSFITDVSLPNFAEAL